MIVDADIVNVVCNFVHWYIPHFIVFAIDYRIIIPYISFAEKWHLQQIIIFFLYYMSIKKSGKTGLSVSSADKLLSNKIS